ncbi:hypothetical protein ABGB07_03750 [Micromonosporaceae bacterium B7E4]
MTVRCDYDPTELATTYVVATGDAPALVRSRFVCSRDRHLRQAEAVVGDGGREYEVRPLGQAREVTR